MPKLLLAILSTITISLLSFSIPRASPKGPDLSPEAVGRLFAQVGFVSGAVRDIEGSTIRLKSIRVEAKDKWIVVHILPERVK